MARKEIKTSTIIDATPNRIWDILTNFSKYSDWNPFLLSVEGNLIEGQHLKINAGGMKFQPEILVVKENQELRWKGKLLFKGLFDGEHKFHIIDNKDGTSTFKQEELFTGLLVGLFAKKLDSETKHGFEAMNQKLKELAEKRF